MRKFIILVFLCISAKSFGGIYKIQDNEKNCSLYFAEDSKFAKTIDISKLERESVTAALIFQKSEEKYNLKGLYSWFSLERNIDLSDHNKEDMMKHTFKSVCLSADNQVIHYEQGRELFNNLNDLDRE